MYHSLCLVIVTCLCYAIALPTESLEGRSKSHLNVLRDDSEKIIASDMTIVTHNDLYGKYIQISA
jgi:hypothetical protein